MNLSSEPVFHKGESLYQSLAHVGQSNTEWVWQTMNWGNQVFLGQLPYFFMGVLDKHGNPWCTVLTGQKGFIKVFDEERIQVETLIPIVDPVAEVLLDSNHPTKWKLFGGVGVMLHNRRRNKFAGKITRLVSSVPDNANNNVRIVFEAEVSQAYGNCPKYITVRDIQYFERGSPVIVYNERISPETCRDGESKYLALPEECVEHIHRSDAMYLSSKRFNEEKEYEQDMDVNHRGGNPGFIRVSEDRKSIVLPDYSGNQLFQSLGNIQIDRLAGGVFPEYDSGDMVHITGDAVNYFDDEASNILPPYKRITVIYITGFKYVKNALQVKSMTPPQFSPYNPPIRYLPHEGSRYSKANSFPKVTTKIVSTKDISESITSFTFQTSEPVMYAPGQYAIFDFNSVMSLGYRHMAEDNPKSINDDLIRSWTITSFPDHTSDGYAKSNTLTVSIKKKDGGLISTILHKMKAKGQGFKSFEGLVLSGISGDFSSFSNLTPSQIKHNKILFIASGVGITPFLAMFEGFKLTSGFRKDEPLDIVLLFSTRASDVGAVKDVDAAALRAGDKVSVNIFRTDTPSGRRIIASDILNVSLLNERHAYVCGPKDFMDSMILHLTNAGLPADQIHSESFTF